MWSRTGYNERWSLGMIALLHAKMRCYGFPTSRATVGYGRMSLVLNKHTRRLPWGASRILFAPNRHYVLLIATSKTDFSTVSSFRSSWREIECHRILILPLKPNGLLKTRLSLINKLSVHRCTKLMNEAFGPVLFMHFIITGISISILAVNIMVF